ncbi:MAG: AmmeMemoRadiSam system radical SAM enzyme [Planctomycetota bacterium]|jgi:pyruvate formate lyase activating enzyme|nr:AmmeMemoRadiSam system radical SAM enzyme [Planctomycetota bacterium]
MAGDGELHKAAYCERREGRAVRCALCPHHCRIAEGGSGACGVRKNAGGELYALSYGRVAAAALDPVEKKPLYHFFPGRPIFSLGGWGCNLKCSYCQNCSLSQFEAPTRPLSPEEAGRAGMEHGSIGVAYTYNEPTVAYEYVGDCCRQVRRRGGKNVLVTNGFIDAGPLDAILPLVDAMNIDVKAFNEDFYHRLCRGALAPVLETVRRAAGKTHLELTTLIIPGENDAIPEMEDLAKWIVDACGPAVPCHLTAYFPSYQMRRAATTAAHLAHARDIFMDYLPYVYAGNVQVPGGGDTRCVQCGSVVVARRAFNADLSGMNPDGSCKNCGADNNIVTA